MMGVEKELYDMLSRASKKKMIAMELWNGSNIYERFFVVCKNPSRVKGRNSIANMMLLHYGISVIFTHRQPKRGRFLWRIEG